MPDNPTSIALIEAFVMADKPVAALCHAPAAFINVRGKDGEYLVNGKRVTGFTNAEEQAVGLTKAIMKIVDLSSRTGVVEEMDRLDSRQAHPTASPGTRFKEANVTNNHPVITGKIVLAHQKALNARNVLAKLEAWRLKG